MQALKGIKHKEHWFTIRIIAGELEFDYLRYKIITSKELDRSLSASPPLLWLKNCSSCDHPPSAIALRQPNEIPLCPYIVTL
jgi:hypothetical protein